MSAVLLVIFVISLGLIAGMVWRKMKANSSHKAFVKEAFRENAKLRHKGSKAAK